MTKAATSRRERRRAGCVRLRVRVVAVIAGPLVLAASACSTDYSTASFGAHPTPTPSVVPLPIPSVTSTLEKASVTSPANYVRQEGTVLPDPKVTPGAVFPDVTTEQVCDLHYTLGIRQPHFNDKVTAFSNYGVSIHERDRYEVDHLVPVSLGGSNAMTNLWPQPRTPEGAPQKNELEAHLRALVCSHQLDLTAAQKAIAMDWPAAARTYLPVPLPPDAGPPSVSATAAPDPYEVKNGAPCPQEGVVGLTENKGIRFTCAVSGDGSLRWGKRY